MSFCRGNRENSEIDLEAVISFLNTLLCMSAGITVTTIAGMIFTLYAGQNIVMYEMTLAINVVMQLFGGFALKSLKNKNKKLKEKEEK